MSLTVTSKKPASFNARATRATASKAKKSKVNKPKVNKPKVNKSKVSKPKANKSKVNHPASLSDAKRLAKRKKFAKQMKALLNANAPPKDGKDTGDLPAGSSGTGGGPAPGMGEATAPSVKTNGKTEIPATMVATWVKEMEPRTGNTVDLNVIGVRHVKYNTTRIYLLSNLKWYHEKRVPKERKNHWKKNSLKVAMSRASISIKDKQSLDTFKGWERFAIQQGASLVDPLDGNEMAWKDYIYTSNYNKSVGAAFIKSHNASL